MELFRMLREVGKGYEKILGSDSGTMDRKNLIDNLNKYLERSKTICILEGRGKNNKDGKHPDGRRRRRSIGRCNHSSEVRR
jgi:cytokinesis protein